jgi:hypothetical protein
MTAKPRAVKLASKDLSLDEAARALLRAIDRGVRVFTPDEETPEALADFQRSVKLLQDDGRPSLHRGDQQSQLAGHWRREPGRRSAAELAC